jgi:hypothetical protein
VGTKLCAMCRGGRTIHGDALYNQKYESCLIWASKLLRYAQFPGDLLEAFSFGYMRLLLKAIMIRLLVQR